VLLMVGVSDDLEELGTAVNATAVLGRTPLTRPCPNSHSVRGLHDAERGDDQLGGAAGSIAAFVDPPDGCVRRTQATVAPTHQFRPVSVKCPAASALLVLSACRARRIAFCSGT
jgi:hypothetical protein